MHRRLQWAATKDKLSEGQTQDILESGWVDICGGWHTKAQGLRWWVICSQLYLNSVSHKSLSIGGTFGGVCVWQKCLGPWHLKASSLGTAQDDLKYDCYGSKVFVVWDSAVDSLEAASIWVVCEGGNMSILICACYPHILNYQFHRS